MHRLRDYYERNEHQVAIAMFVGGFLFDMIMVGRVDSWETIGQQVVYLAVITFALMQMFFEEVRPPRNLATVFALRRWYYEYRMAIVHFFFGTLLNMYMIFFFKSSSLLVSFGFLAGLVFLLLANESHRFRKLGLSFKFALLSICFFSFFSCVVPIAIGRMGTLVFLFSMMVGALPLLGVTWWIQSHRNAEFDRAKRQILLPLLSVFLGYLMLYLLKITPPVPLSIPFIGVYHGVERENGQFQLANERLWWKFWQNGDQDFLAQTGDKIYVAFRVFSPTRFSDQVAMRWYWRDNKLGWVLQDSIPIKIVGGREEGFRGYGVKSNYTPGRWKVHVETSDGREIGRVYFNLELSETAPRTFEHDLM